MTLKKVIGWAIVIFLAYYVIADPNSASHLMHSLLGDLNGIGSSLATFLNGL